MEREGDEGRAAARRTVEGTARLGRGGLVEVQRCEWLMEGLYEVEKRGLAGWKGSGSGTTDGVAVAVAFASAPSPPQQTTSWPSVSPSSLLANPPSLMHPVQSAKRARTALEDHPNSQNHSLDPAGRLNKRLKPNSGGGFFHDLRSYFFDVVWPHPPRGTSHIPACVNLAVRLTRSLFPQPAEHARPPRPRPAQSLIPRFAK
jgi:hypothetical protein